MYRTSPTVPLTRRLKIEREKCGAYCGHCILIEKGAAVDIEDMNGYTPLYWALLKKKYKIASLLLEKGADIDYQDISGQTALHKVVYHKNIDAIKFLLEHRASRQIKDVQGKLPIDYAEKENIKEMLYE